MQGVAAGDVATDMALESLLTMAKTGTTVPNLLGAEWDFGKLEQYMDVQSEAFQGGRIASNIFTGMAGAVQFFSGLSLVIGSIGGGVAVTIGSGGTAALAAGEIAWAGVAAGAGKWVLA